MAEPSITQMVMRPSFRRMLSGGVIEKALGAPNPTSYAERSQESRYGADFRVRTRICDGLPETTGNFRRLASTT